MSDSTVKQVKPSQKVTQPSRMMNQSSSGSPRIKQSSINKRSVNASMSQRRFSLARESKVLDKGSILTSKHTVQLFDETGKDVTPRPLYQQAPGAIKPKQNKLFTGHNTPEGTVSDFLSTINQTMSASSAAPFTMSVLGSSFMSKVSHCVMESVSNEIEEFSAKQEPLICLSELKLKREEEVKEPRLDIPVDIYLTETENMCLLDIPSVSVCVDSEEAKEVEKRNKAYAEICRNRQGNDKYVDRAMQTFNAALKCKEVQSDHVDMEEKGVIASAWDIYDFTVSNNGIEKSNRNNNADTVSITNVPSSPFSESNRGLQSTAARGSATSTASARSSQKEMQASTAQMMADAPIPEQILHSEKFKQSLLVMEKSVVLNIFQRKLAAYKGLPVLPDPDCGGEDTVEDKEEDLLSPALRRLWVFSCKLSKGHSVTSMTWNKHNPDILAVGYGETDFKKEKSGLVCIWSLKIPTRPEIFFTCKTSVTSLDFSASKPSHLAVGLYDGTIAIYNLQSSQASLVCDSRNCPQKHRSPVWQVKWVNLQGGSGEDEREKLFSVSADARISEWFLHQGLDCTNLMKLKRIRNEKTEKVWKEEPLLSYWAVGLCFDFHHNDSNIYLVGTEEGHIYECSCSYNEQFLETYTNHLGPVYKVIWSPFCRDAFLSCSADCTIQLWSRGHFTPLLNFTSIKKAVYDIMWSPRWPTVFGAVNEDRLEIWNLGESIVNPTLVSEVIPGVKPTCLLFTMNTDCVLVGDSEGQVRVYRLQNFTAGEETQERTLNNIISSRSDSQC